MLYDLSNLKEVNSFFNTVIIPVLFSSVEVKFSTANSPYQK